MKKKIVTGLLSTVLCVAGMSLPVCAETVSEQPLRQEKAAEENVLRNTVFTSKEQMQQMMGLTDPEAWSVSYLPEVEQCYWNFSRPGEQDKKELSMELVSNAYQNLEMLLDNGYLLDYHELADYAADYLVRRGEQDAYYTILTECLKNPYLLNKPEAVVTDYTYNGRDYSAVFDPDYYYDANPDLQASIGFNPPELLRHFVEKGIIQGRKGNASFDPDAYMAKTDGEIAVSRAGVQAPGPMPVVAKYSYSRANYYGRFLGHYDYTAVYGPVEEEKAPGEMEENTVDW